MDVEQLRRRQKTNQIVARCIPAFLVAVVGYASYVFVGPLCVNYLLNPSPETRAPQRIAVGIALPIVYFFLLLPVAVAYFRLIYVVTWNPGVIPQRQPAADALQDEAHNSRQKTAATRSCAPTTIATGREPDNLDIKGILEHRVPAPPGIENFYQRDVFVCDANGLPLWCPTCCNWKPDRSHHSSDVGRCVLKMDHFCPWVGGVVGENGFKFFVQFCTYAMIFTAYILACMAVFVAESEQERGTIGNVHWVIAIGLSGFFCFFTFGLNLMSYQFILKESTTIENIDAAQRTMYLAVLLPPDLQTHPLPAYPPPTASRTTTPPSRSGDSERPLTSEIDDPAHANYFNPNPRPSRSRKRLKEEDDPAASYWQGTITYPLYLPPDRPPLPAPEPRTFAILRTPPGMNPWNCGAFFNFTSVFGHSLHDWVLPLRYSPCTRHDSMVSWYAMGFEFEELLEDARLVQPPEFIKRARRRGSSLHKRKRRRKLDYGWQNGERPDGWEMEKEARRMRREARERERRGEA